MNGHSLLGLLVAFAFAACSCARTSGPNTGTYTVVSTTPPAQMDIHGQKGPNAGRTIQTIFELAGDQLTVCYQLGSGERPSEFKSAAGPQVLLIHYQRVQ